MLIMSVLLRFWEKKNKGVLAFINCWDVKWSTMVQDVLTYAKLFALFIIIGTGIYQLCIGNPFIYFGRTVC